jgi:hypothetical protein
LILDTAKSAWSAEDLVSNQLGIQFFRLYGQQVNQGVTAAEVRSRFMAALTDVRAALLQVASDRRGRSYAFNRRVGMSSQRPPDTRSLCRSYRNTRVHGSPHAGRYRRPLTRRTGGEPRPCRRRSSAAPSARPASARALAAWSRQIAIIDSIEFVLRRVHARVGGGP